MKSFEFFGFLFLLLLSLNGCIAMAPFIAPAGLALSTTGAVVSIHQEITRADFKLTVNAGIDKMPGIVKATFNEVGIAFEKEQKNEAGDAVIFEGKTASDVNVKIAAATLTGKACDVGIWATQGSFLGGIRKADFAGMIGAQLIQQVEIAKNDGNKKRDPAPVKKAPAKTPTKKAPVKKPAVGKDG